MDTSEETPPLVSVLTRALQESQNETLKLRQQIQGYQCTRGQNVEAASSVRQALDRREADVAEREAVVEEAKRAMDARMSEFKERTERIVLQHTEDVQTARQQRDTVTRERDELKEALAAREVDVRAGETALCMLVRENENLKQVHTSVAPSVACNVLLGIAKQKAELAATKPDPQLVEKLGNAEDTISSLRADIERWRAANVEAQEKLAAADKELTIRGNQLQDRDTKLLERDTKLQARDAELKSRSKSIAALKSDLAAVRSDTTAAHARNDTLRKENAALHARLLAAETTAQNLVSAQQRASDLEQESNVLRVKLFAAEHRETAQLANVATLTAELDTLRTQCAKVTAATQEAMDKSKVERDALKAQVSAAEGRASSTTTALRLMRQEKDEMEVRLKTKTGEVEGARRSVREATAQKERAEEERDEMELELAQKGKEVQESLTLIKELEEKLATIPLAPPSQPRAKCAPSPSMRTPPIAFIPEDDDAKSEAMSISTDGDHSEDMLVDTQTPLAPRSMRTSDVASPTGLSKTEPVHHSKGSRREDEIRASSSHRSESDCSPQAERQLYLDYMKAFEWPATRQPLADLRSVGSELDAREILREIEDRSTRSCVFLPNRLVWCTSKQVHALGFAPPLVLDKWDKWVPDTSLLYEVGREVHLLVEDCHALVYAGIYSVHSMRSVVDRPAWVQSTVPSDVSTAAVLDAMGLRRRGSKGAPEIQYARLRDLYPDSVPRVECFGLQCVGFDEELYDVLRRTDWRKDNHIDASQRREKFTNKSKNKKRKHSPARTGVDVDRGNVDGNEDARAGKKGKKKKKIRH
ncbi:hypothetical protein MKEN_00557800 [Mycena kentingensis (nom. inval.)]|nr:hypothetical protein MKEN_00557800 [Mycena kentingensis (nom. inval.)]